MAYDSSCKYCGTCRFWTGSRNFGAFDTIDFSHGAPGNCGKPGVAVLTGGYPSNKGACNDWKYAL